MRDALVRGGLESPLNYYKVAVFNENVEDNRCKIALLLQFRVI